MPTSVMCSPNDVDGGVWQRWGGRRQLQAGVAPEAQRHDWVEGWGGAGWSGFMRQEKAGFVIEAAIALCIWRLRGRSTSALSTSQGAPAVGRSRAEGRPRSTSCRSQHVTLTGTPHVAAAEEDEHEGNVDQRHEGGSAQPCLQHQPPEWAGRRNRQRISAALHSDWGSGDAAGRSGAEQ